MFGGQSHEMSQPLQAWKADFKPNMMMNDENDKYDKDKIPVKRDV